MNWIVFIEALFSERKNGNSIYHEAVSEGIKDALKGMDPQAVDEKENEIETDPLHSHYCIN
jgi:hypothetical protein